MKRTSEEPLNKSHKKAKFDPTVTVKQNLNLNGHATNENGWSKVEKRKKKKANKIETGKVDVPHPRFMYSTHDILRRHHAVSVDEIRELVLHLVADAQQPSWLRIENANTIQRVVALLIPGLTPEILALPPRPTSSTSNPNLPISIPLLAPPPPPPPPVSTREYDDGDDDGEDEGGGEEEEEEEEIISTAACIPFIASTFSHACPTRAPGDSTKMHSVLSTFFTGPISSEVKRKKNEEKDKSEIHASDPTQYILTLEQMIENDYPIPSYMAEVFQKPEGEWLETPKPGQTESKWKQKIYAVDCEMCETEDGKELTRACMIDFATGVVVYDQLVKPAKPILDYLTKWSGITAEALSKVTTTLEQVQTEIMGLLTAPAAPPEPKRNPFSMDTTTPPVTVTPSPPATPILIGHSLESDLKALKICHPRCIDTALLYHHPRGRPLKPGLAWLTKKWCGRQIQTRGDGGHDPEEDAQACIDLLKLKMEYGPGFGEYKVDYESIFERMGRCDGKGVVGKVKSAVVDHGNPSVMHGAKANTAIGCKTDEQVLDGLLGVIPSHQFAFGRFMALANALGWVTPKASVDSATIPAAPSTAIDPPSAAELAPVLSTLNQHLQKLHQAFPPRTAFVIFTGHSDPRKMSMLNARKNAFETALKSGKSLEEISGKALTWTAADARELEGAVEVARRGLLFLGIKQ